MAENTLAAAKARALYLGRHHGILSTHSVDLPGYPFGSIAPYAIDRGGEAVILISDIAQHTKNIIENNRVSLTMVEDERANDDVQDLGRITYVGTAVVVEDADTDSRERYYLHYPRSRNYHLDHDFTFYRLKLERVRYIGGFGEIYWVELADFLLKNPFTPEEESQITSHMNNDHQDALKHYLRVSAHNVDAGDEEIAMAGIDSEGFDISAGLKLYRISFKKRINSTEEARAALVEMTRFESI